jgi:hypothetical protein
MARPLRPSAGLIYIHPMSSRDFIRIPLASGASALLGLLLLRLAR